MKKKSGNPLITNSPSKMKFKPKEELNSDITSTQPMESVEFLTFKRNKSNLESKAGSVNVDPLIEGNQAQVSYVHKTCLTRKVYEITLCSVEHR